MINYAPAIPRTPAPEGDDKQDLWWLDYGRRFCDDLDNEIADAELAGDAATLRFLRWREIGVRRWLKHRARGGSLLTWEGHFIADPPKGMPADVARRIRQERGTPADFALWHRLKAPRDDAE